MVITYSRLAKAFRPNTNKVQTLCLATRSPGLKSLGLTFVLYRVVVACFMEASVRATKFLHSSMNFSSSRVGSTLALWSSGYAVLLLNSFTSTGITISVPKVRRNDVSPVDGVNFAKKSTNVWAFISFFASKVISNWESSIDHAVILPAKSGWNNTFFSGYSVWTTMEWARKYFNNLLVATMRESATFSTFW